MKNIYRQRVINGTKLNALRRNFINYIFRLILSIEETVKEIR